MADSFVCPLTGAALGNDVADGEHAQREPLSGILSICRTVLVDRDLEPTDLPMLDRIAVVRWAMQEGIGDAVEDVPETVTAADLVPFVKGQHALLVDMVCRRYPVRPSTLLGIDDPDMACDFDMAIGVRGLQNERKTNAMANPSAGPPDPDGPMVAVVDINGNTIEVPAGWHPQHQIPHGSRVTHADEYARKYGAMTFGTAGGAISPR